MKNVSRSIGLAFPISPYILRYVLGQIMSVSLIYWLISRQNEMAAEVFLLCIVTVGVSDALAYDWRNMVKKILQKDEA